MNEFLTGLSSGQPLLWAAFVLGVMAVAALTLSTFWAGVFRLAEAFTRERTEERVREVLARFPRAAWQRRAWQRRMWWRRWRMMRSMRRRARRDDVLP